MRGSRCATGAPRRGCARLSCGRPALRRVARSVLGAGGGLSSSGHGANPIHAAGPSRQGRKDSRQRRRSMLLRLWHITTRKGGGTRGQRPPWPCTTASRFACCAPHPLQARLALREPCLRASCTTPSCAHKLRPKAHNPFARMGVQRAMQPSGGVKGQRPSRFHPRACAERRFLLYWYLI